VEVVSVQSDREFDELREPWQGLVENDTHASVFQTYEWQRTWWKHYGGSDRLRILLVRLDGRIVGILPLYESQQPLRGLGHARALRLIGIGGDTAPDYLGAITLPEYTEQAVQSLSAYLLRESGWDVAEFTDLRSDSPLLSELRRVRLPLGFSRHDARTETIYYTRLPDSWEDYLATLHREQRKEIRSKRRKFLAEPGARMFSLVDIEDLPRIFEALITIHRRRWQEKGERHAFSSPQYLAFHRDLTRSFMELGRLRMYCMELNDRVIGIQYCYVFRGTMYAFQCGFDPEFGKLSPGMSVLGLAVESAIGERCAEFDLLRGDHEYKRYWAKLTRTTESVSLYRPSNRALLYRVLTRSLPRATRHIRRFLGS
jgi:CelD/BcsL family acetyltransferase involved in cellulose biosynthesis